MRTVTFEGITFNISEFRSNIIKIAKRHSISLVLTTDREIEFIELDEEKARRFAREVNEFSPSTRLIELSKIGQHIDTKGNSLLGSKSRFLIDDEYYNLLIGESMDHVGQLDMF